MKRIILLLALPAVLAVIWVGGRRATTAEAHVDIRTDKVIATRGEVLNAVDRLGGRKVSEESRFSNGTASELVFNIPADQIERALADLDQIGGEVTDQSVDLSDRIARTGSWTDHLGAVRDCISKASTASGSAAEVRAAASACGNVLDDTRPDAEADTPAVLAVRIHPSGGMNPFLIVAGIAVVSTLLITGAAVIISSRRAGQIDLRDPTGVIHFEEDSFLRRN